MKNNMVVSVVILSLLPLSLCAQTEFSEVHVGNVSGDNWLRLKQSIVDEYSYDFQHNNASVMVNEQGSTNQALILGDVDYDKNNVLFGIAHKWGSNPWLSKFTLGGNGKLALGSHLPESNLDIRSQGTVSTFLKSLDSNGDATFFMGEQGNSNELKIFGFEFRYDGANTNQLILDRYDQSTTPETVLRIDRHTGNMALGTSDLSHKLSVNGTIRTQEVKVEASPWPDYVFSDTYQLNPLSEVSTYIEKNHHLPGIPTAQEVAENGIKLGEMNAKLLEKVEELTLYLIEQNEKIEKQQKEIEFMKSILK